jgi:Arc/MetJ family transcription regulator
MIRMIRTHRRYDGDMRTNIVIDDELMAKALRLSGMHTKREVVDAALREFVKRRDQSWILEIFGSNPNAEYPPRGDDFPWLDD